MYFKEHGVPHFHAIYGEFNWKCGKLSSSVNCRVWSRSMRTYPRVKSVQALPGKRLRVTFESDEVRVYDCMPLLDEAAFQHLRDDAFFRNVTADRHGYGVVWTDDLDLAESELWLHGTPEQAGAVGPR